MKYNLPFFILSLTVLYFSACNTDIEVHNNTVSIKKQPIVFDATQYSADSIKLLKFWEQYNIDDDNSRFEAALRSCQEIIIIGKQLTQQRFDSTIYEKYAKAYGGIGWNLMMLGDYDKALQYSKLGFNLITEKFGENHIRNTQICVGIASNYSARGDYDQAIEYINRGTSIMSRILPPNHHYFGNNYGNLSNIYLEMGYYTESKLFARNMLKNRLALPENKYMVPEAFWLISKIFRHENKPDSALIYAKKALHFSLKDKEASELNTTYSYFELGAVYNAIHDHKNARKYLHLFIKKIPYQNDYFEGLYTLGDGYFELGKLEASESDFSVAIQYFNKAQEAYKLYHGPTTISVANCISSIASCYIVHEKFESGLRYYQSGLSFLIPSFKPVSIFENPDPNELVPTETILQLLNEKRDALRHFAEYTKDPSHWKLAFETARLVLELVGKMRESYKWEGSKQYMSAKAVPALQQALEIGMIYQKMINNTNLSYDYLNLLEQNKAYTLREAVQDKTIQRISLLPQWAMQREDSLKQALRFTQETIAEQQRKKVGADSVLLLKLQVKRLKLNESLDSIKQVLKKNYPDYYQLQFSQTGIPISKLQNEVLHDNTAFVEFFWGDSIVFAISLSKNISQPCVIPLDESLKSDLETLTQIDPSTSIQKFSHSARTLYTRLIAPVLPKDQTIDKLIIIPDGPLGALPFQLLLERDPDPKMLADENWRELPYLLQSKFIRYEYSAALLLDKSNKRKLKRFYAGFAPIFSGQPLASRGIDSAIVHRHWRGGIVPDLKQNRPEVQAVHAMLNTGNAFLAEVATERAFKQQAPGCKVLHLATHACADDEDPLYSQILFSRSPTDTSEDGALHAYELYNMRLNADLAVLSACQTGAGRVQRGEGTMSLARAFKYAGCPNIVMSLWNADDDASRTIMVDFFKKLKAGQGKSEALCQAQRDYLATATLTQAHPSRWATFVLIGDDAPVSFNSDKWLVALLTLGLCTLVVYLFFLQPKT